MSAFHDVNLPLALAIGASGGPERLTDIVRLASGVESRNTRWSQSRRRWEVGGAAMGADAAHKLVAFLEARRGRAYGFRFRDPVDWKSCAPGQAIAATDQPLGAGDGVRASFQLAKRYQSGDAWTERVITKPLVGSVVVALGGVIASDVTIDHLTGTVTFAIAPASGVPLTAGFAFDTPVRFDTDRLEMALVGHEAVRVLRAPLVEIAG